MREKTRIAAVVLVVASPTAVADSWYCRSNLITDGSSVTKVMRSCPEPASKETIENRFGAKIGERWYFPERSKTVVLTIRAGQVVSIRDIRD